MTTNPAEQSVDTAQREQTMRFLQQMSKQRQQEQGYTPIVKSMQRIGLEPRVMTVMIGDEPTDCVVIPVVELMTKEWQFLSGIPQGLNQPPESSS